MSDEICRCSHPKEFHQSFLKEVPCDYDGKCVVGCQKFEPVGPDRHPKWQRVEPGTVIPAGQPHRVEYTGNGYTDTMTSAEYVRPETYTSVSNTRGKTWFIDSSWKPPLELPTEPTWGIAVTKYAGSTRLARWDGNGESVWVPAERYGRAGLLDFIPLTEEQVARIEAAR